jgi:hypothetical protein
VTTWFNFRTGAITEQHFIIAPDGADKAALDKTEPNSKGRWRVLYEVADEDLLMAVTRTAKGKQKADYSLPKHPTEAQIVRLREFLSIYQRGEAA